MKDSISFSHLHNNRIFGNLVFLCKLLVHDYSCLLFDERLRSLEWKTLIFIETLNHIQKGCQWNFKGKNSNMRIACLLTSVSKSETFHACSYSIVFETYDEDADYCLYLLDLEEFENFEKHIVRFNNEFYEMHLFVPNIVNPCDSQVCVYFERLKNKTLNYEDWSIKQSLFLQQQKEVQTNKLKEANAIFDVYRTFKELLSLRYITLLLFFRIFKLKHLSTEWINLCLKDKIHIIEDLSLSKALRK